MNPPRFKNTLILQLLVALHKVAPEKLFRILKRSGFKPGDVTFRTTKSGLLRAEIHRWPWGEDSDNQYLK